jgi:hypothetical protein
MNFQTFSIARNGVAKRPRIYFHGTWLAQMGFMPGVLIQAIPEPDGMIFRLCDENIPKYSVLALETHVKGGKLLQGCCEQGMTLVTSGDYILNGGLNLGDACIARYDYGIIRVRKLPPQTKIITTKRGLPKSRMICGTLLTTNGFNPGSLATVAAEPGKIFFSLQEQGIESYREMVRRARAEKMSLLQVVNAAGVIRITIPDLCLHKAGFAIDDAFVVHYNYGALTLKKLDFEALGF